MSLLIQFLLRLTFGLALGMAITSPKLVTSGYFRNHLYVTLGLSALAAMLCFSVAPSILWYAIAAAICSYLGSIYWLFEKHGPGQLMLWIVTSAALAGALSQSLTDSDAVDATVATQGVVASEQSPESSLTKPIQPSPQQRSWLFSAATISSGLLLGLTMAAMLLGHWYLNTPTMELVPLRRLLVAMAVAVALQTLLSLVGLWGEVAASQQLTLQWMLFVALRWTFGLIGVAVMTWMAWQTLKIPNTQSATGILYVAVIGTFVGETMALLLSTESMYPL